MRFLPLLAGAVLVLTPMSASAQGAGGAEPLPTPDVVQAAPDNDWSGFYLGALLGYSSGETRTDDALSGDIDGDGVDGGAYAGAQWQLGNVVLGGEGDLLVSGLDGEENGIAFDQGLNGSVRARAGIALDDFLLYGTGGAAVSNVELEGSDGGEDQTLWGWTAGAGAEAALTDMVTARVEYRYTDYEDETFSLGGGAGDVETDLSTHSVRAGVGVRF